MENNSRHLQTQFGGDDADRFRIQLVEVGDVCRRLAQVSKRLLQARLGPQSRFAATALGDVDQGTFEVARPLCAYDPGRARAQKVDPSDLVSSASIETTRPSSLIASAMQPVLGINVELGRGAAAQHVDVVVPHQVEQGRVHVDDFAVCGRPVQRHGDSFE